MNTKRAEVLADVTKSEWWNAVQAGQILGRRFESDSNTETKRSQEFRHECDESVALEKERGVLGRPEH